MQVLNPKRWYFFGKILWRVFEKQDTMFGGKIVARVPWNVAWKLAFKQEGA